MEGLTYRGRGLSRFLVYCSAAFMMLLLGCATVSQRDQRGEVLALVNGIPVTEGDLAYALQVAHRREDLTGAGSLNVSDYMQKIIDDMLVIEEARRMGLEKDTSVVKAVEAYVLRESVVRLHDEEILAKVQVAEEDIVNYYKKSYEFFTIEVIEAESAEKAGEVLVKLNEGGDFEELADEYSVRQEEEQTHEVVISRLALSQTPEVEEAVLAMSPGETRGVIESRGRYFIVKFVKREDAPMDKLETGHVRSRVEKSVRDLKEEARKKEYAAFLREQADKGGALHVDEAALSAIDLGEGAEKWKGDQTPVVRAYEEVLTAGGIADRAKPDVTKEQIVENWIDYALINHEALSRNYEEKTGLKEMLESYTRQLLKDAFIKKAILPRITVSEQILMDYYSEHKESFAESSRYRVQQITLKSMEDAEAALGELKGGADFSWIAKNRSTDGVSELGGNLGWKTKAFFPPQIREILDSLDIGQLSPVVGIDDSTFRIIRMLGKEEGRIPDFNVVREAVFKKYFTDRFNSILGENVAQLREGADIEINEKALRSMEEKIRGGR